MDLQSSNDVSLQQHFFYGGLILIGDKRLEAAAHSAGFSNSKAQSRLSVKMAPRRVLLKQQLYKRTDKEARGRFAANITAGVYL